MKQFIQLQPRKWKDIYTLYFSLTDKTPEERLEAVNQHLIAAGFDPEQAASISSSLLKTFTPELTESFMTEEDEAALSLYDIQRLKEKLLHEPSQDIRRLLVAFLVYARANPHPSFWIKNDKKVINFLASIQKLKVSEQIYLTNQLHTCYNLDMRVVGSTQPIPCFRISWQADQPPIDSEENPLVLIGPLNPATIKAFAEQIPYKEKGETPHEPN